MSVAESGLAYRIGTIFETDYFIQCHVEFGVISHGLPVLVRKESGRIGIILNPEGQTVGTLQPGDRLLVSELSRHNSEGVILTTGGRCPAPLEKEDRTNGDS